jgi:dolichol-phosphate mannosyltransferase
MDQEVVGDVLPPSPEPTLDLSVVCPFYNEAGIIGKAVTSLLEKLEELEARLGIRWELIVVNDGSKDDSYDIVSEIAERSKHLRAIGYPFNRGRGAGLRAGITQARGAVIVTTEIDLSWGDDIVDRLYAAMVQAPEVDIVIASPHMPGGRYKNVPANRVFFSRFGNFVIRRLMSNAVTMNTGMTRAYRREVIQSLPLEEDGKEFHLEVVLKAQALNYRFAEIPATLEWKEYKLEGARVERKSSSKVNKLVLSHSLFSLFANPIRYISGLALATLVLSGGFLLAGLIRYAMGLVSVYMLIVSLALIIIAITLFGFGVIAQQNNMIQREIWGLKQEQLRLQLDRRRRRNDQGESPESPNREER